jgi:hypothetical protein
MGEVFRYQWHDPRPVGLPDDWWFAIGRDDQQWWFNATLVGPVRLQGGAAQAAAFASWLLATPPIGPYEKEFLLVDQEPRPHFAVAEHTTLTIEVLLARETADGPECLTVMPTGDAPEQGFAFEWCGPLYCEPLDRVSLEEAAAKLLVAAREGDRTA